MSFSASNDEMEITAGAKFDATYWFIQFTLGWPPVYRGTVFWWQLHNFRSRVHVSGCCCKFFFRRWGRGLISFSDFALCKGLWESLDHSFVWSLSWRFLAILFENDKVVREEDEVVAWNTRKIRWNSRQIPWCCAEKEGEVGEVLLICRGGGKDAVVLHVIIFQKLEFHQYCFFSVFLISDRCFHCCLAIFL